MTEGHNVNNISSVCDFGISSTFDAVLRYLPILFCGIMVFVDIFCDIAVFGTPMSPRCSEAISQSGKPDGVTEAITKAVSKN